MRLPEDAFPEVEDYFDPPLYTNEELVFIKANLGKVAYLAMQDADETDAALKIAKDEDAAASVRLVRKGRGSRPDRPSAVRNFQAVCGNALQRFHQLAESNTHAGTEWVVTNLKTKKAAPGYEGIGSHIDRWLRRQGLFLERKEADPNHFGFHPELWTINAEGTPTWSGRGTDSQRVRYPLVLVPLGMRTYDDFTKLAYGEENEPPPGIQAMDGFLDLIEGDDYYECPIDGCGKRSEFDPDSNMAKNKARNGMRVHMGRPAGKRMLEEHQMAKERINW
jgi:hypothetical protein